MYKDWIVDGEVKIRKEARLTYYNETKDTVTGMSRFVRCEFTILMICAQFITYFAGNASRDHKSVNSVIYDCEISSLTNT
jgi:hypothetical protein